jgi:uncharacterized oligopeptide transporter (OPT) family protein
MHRSDEAGRELTFRAVFAGMAIGGVLALGNIYLGLRTGFWTRAASPRPSSGFALIAPLARGASSRFSPAEHNVLVAAAMAVASTPSVMGLIGAVPALSLLGAAPSTAVLTLWAVVLGAMGILVALPLRVLLVERDNLPFPTARATGEVIAAAHAHESHARRRALALGGAAIAAAPSRGCATESPAGSPACCSRPAPWRPTSSSASR